jgi:hypothetical protein
VDAACRVDWRPYGSMYKNPKNVQKWIGKFEFFLVWSLGMWGTRMVFDQFFYGYEVWLVSAWAYASGCGR